MLLVSHLVFTILANVKLKLTLNTSTTQEFTAMDIMDIFQRSTTLLPLQLSTTMLTTEFTTPMLASTILASVMPKLILNGCSITDILHTPAILDTLDSLDTPLPTTMAMSGTVLNTCGKNKMKNKNFTF